MKQQKKLAELPAQNHIISDSLVVQILLIDWNKLLPYKTE
jgi:hypothetical protein